MQRVIGRKDFCSFSDDGSSFFPDRLSKLRIGNQAALHLQFYIHGHYLNRFRLQKESPSRTRLSATCQRRKKRKEENSALGILLGGEIFFSFSFSFERRTTEWGFWVDYGVRGA
ncbi:hypothetical protein BU24DRAFT_180996 [Aaosphaeria arxii CBS 175.79]|uniref:Uncharacterized protein n=1 Tax=Aaosphaeria arxii CBS 175.79 TaxID=1450172 RepID=A0A6A5XTM1_9PLEO|nr:uncharacterized protein BU24DRAFT_180996 [Aaosphaeria arxii CBS 175.79]KAF2015594.1 hypothetical protein BU24DRAFT_180996 [Aaosphaeria arxii CBS 175.79]